MKRVLTFIFTSGLIALMCLFFQTCKKDKVCKQDEQCENFPKKEGIGVSIITQKPFQRHAPCFNPNNGNEIIYVKEENNKYQLVKFNIQSKVETVLLDNTIIVGQPKWGENGWIVFSKLDLNVYLLKENGDSLKQITTYFENNHPSFIGNTKVFISVGAETSPGASGNKIIDLEGNRVDSIKPQDFGRVYGINHVNKIIEVTSMGCENGGNCSIDYLNLSTKILTKLNEFQFSGRNNLTGIFWHPNDEDIYYSTVREGLFKVNKSTKTLTKIKCGCDSRSYRYLSISPDGSKIIVERVDATDYQNKTGSWTEEGKIYIMDIDGNNEKNVFE
jgi:Tol biopolymer transport system component